MDRRSFFKSLTAAVVAVGLGRFLPAKESPEPARGIPKPSINTHWHTHSLRSRENGKMYRVGCFWENCPVPPLENKFMAQARLHINPEDYMWVETRYMMDYFDEVVGFNREFSLIPHWGDGARTGTCMDTSRALYTIANVDSLVGSGCITKKMVDDAIAESRRTLGEIPRSLYGGPDGQFIRESLRQF